MPPSPGGLSIPRTSALLESSAWPHSPSACPVCPRLDPGEAPKGGIWKKGKSFEHKCPRALPALNQPTLAVPGHAAKSRDAASSTPCPGARAHAASHPCAEPWHGCWSEGHQRPSTPSSGARAWSSWAALCSSPVPRDQHPCREPSVRGRQLGQRSPGRDGGCPGC